LEQSVYIAKPR